MTSLPEDKVRHRPNFQSGLDAPRVNPMGETGDAKGFDEITKAEHYNSHPSGVEAKHLLRLMPFNLGTAMKYVLRAGLKGKRQGDKVKDLRKAEFYVLDEEENRAAAPMTGRSKVLGAYLVNKIVGHRTVVHQGTDVRSDPTRYSPRDDEQNTAIKALWHAADCPDNLIAVTSALTKIRVMLHKAEAQVAEGTPIDLPMEHAP